MYKDDNSDSIQQQRWVVKHIKYCEGADFVIGLPYGIYTAITGVGTITYELYYRWIGISYYYHGFMNQIAKQLMKKRYETHCRDGFDVPSLEAHLMASIVTYVFLLFCTSHKKTHFYATATFVAIHAYVCCTLASTGNASWESLGIGTLLGMFLSIPIYFIAYYHITSRAPFVLVFKSFASLGYRNTMCNPTVL